ncbi:MAG TPA: NUDIX hydrolase [Longimicrobium sp.]|nr:NUDIX hydrolase [Longimicrobium sp.]
MPQPHIRPKAVCVVRRGAEILVCGAVDAVKGETFYGPLGGGIEFCEHAADAVCREMMEELGAELADVRLLGVLENIFTYQGRPGHEIVFVFIGRFADASLYERDELRWTESDGTEWRAEWLPLGHFAPGGPPLYPTGIVDLLRADSDSQDVD